MANIKLRAQTGASLTVAALGLSLMLATVLAIAAYLASHNPGELLIIMAFYLLIAALAAAYNWRYAMGDN